MIKLPSFSISVVFSFILFTSCGSNGNLSNSDEKSSENIDSINQNNKPKNKEEQDQENATSDFYSLKEIYSYNLPHGRIYEFDSKKKKWCQRPTPYELKIYNNGQDDYMDKPNIYDEITHYFDDKTTRQLNSCFLIIKTKGEQKNVSLVFGGNFMFEKTVEENSNQLNVKGPFKYFNLAENAGVMMLEGGRDYNISLENQPSIKYKNDFGDYELKFEKYNLEKAGKTFATVVSEKAIFHSKPDESKKDRSYVVKNQAVFFDKSEGDFVHALFTNNLGVVSEGWLLKSDLNVVY